MTDDEFTALCEFAVLPRAILLKALVDASVAAERERCATLCERLSVLAGRKLNTLRENGDSGIECAAALREATARAEQKRDLPHHGFTTSGSIGMP